ncbi:hypothetical protein [Gandjariella thermophila]|uniref:Uncharacterized protein n=1 Tax=Gandjariella thermophila TaxID=1931992 RepID=A0A4D4J2S7_9PSEU|nr:hypothetical protein [Gandjariella thermophila]GDY29724.1 hypothetical protein GTS_13570 [Gandjariella thermophila]
MTTLTAPGARAVAARAPGAGFALGTPSDLRRGPRRAVARRPGTAPERAGTGG